MATNVLRLKWMLWSFSKNRFFFLQSLQYGLFFMLTLLQTSAKEEGREICDSIYFEKIKSAAENQKHLTSAYWLHNLKTWPQKDPGMSKTPNCPRLAAPMAVSTQDWWLWSLPTKRGLTYGHKCITSVWHWSLGLILCCQQSRAFRRQMTPKKLHNVWQLTDSPRRKRLAP